MDHFHKLSRQVQRHSFIDIFIENLFLLGVGVGLIVLLPSSKWIALAVVGGLAIVAAILTAVRITNYSLSSLYFVWQAALHVAPQRSSAPAPDLSKAKAGKELVESMVLEIYQLASQDDPKTEAEHRKAIIQAANVVSHLPIPMFVFNKQQIVVNASNAGLEYCHVGSSQLFGKPLFENINFEFPTDNTLERWILDCQKNKITDMAYWQRVRVRQPSTELRQCDIAAYYNRDNPSGTEFIVTLFDRTQQYNQDDEGISFVALAVHELRTPLTMLRGYIEVFQDELEGKLDPELAGFMQKMIVAAQQLAAFFNNILNVARIEQNQLSLKLTEGNWGEILTGACNELNLKAQVHNRKLNVAIAPNLPTVAVDRVSIVEVVNNLIDNAIKYSKEGETINVSCQLSKEGYVQTLVQDHGVGIPGGVVPHLFDKFYRNHRTSGSVGGTGLGLYLSKAIVNAHGGQIWVQSKEGEGSTFGFTLVPASQFAAELKTGNNGIVRNAYGWIKNHNMYRR